MIKKLSTLLTDLDSKKGPDFEGLGIIVYSDLTNLPVSSIVLDDSTLLLPKEKYDDILNTLFSISTLESKFHDGFHLLSSDFVLTGISKYFSTPIISDLKIQNNYGSRYRTALYGSFVENVLYTAVLSKNYGPVIFEKGVEINPDAIY